MKTQINGMKITKIGDSYYIRIPADFLKFGNLNAENEYNVELEEVKKEV